LIVRAFGKTVRPILIAFERFGSSTVTSFFTSPVFYIRTRNIFILKIKYHHEIIAKKE
jgi:hypothetical protein